MQIIREININKNFWEVNPECKYVFHYIEHNESTSKLMWAYTLFYHPKSSFYEMSVSERLDSVQRFLENPEWHPEYTEESVRLSKDFEIKCLTKIQRNVLIWGKKLDERTEFVDSTEYNATSVDMIEKLMTNTKKVFDAYKEALAEMEKEDSSVTFGGISESPIELGWFDS